MDEEPFLVGLRLSGRRCVVLGDNPAVIRRVRDLQRTGADLCVIVNDPSTAAVIKASGVPVEQREYRKGDLKDTLLTVICLTNEIDLPLQEAAAERCLVYIPDTPQKSDVILMAIVRRDPVQIGISTGGRSPAAARRLMERLDAMLTSTLGPTVDEMSHARTHFKTEGQKSPAMEESPRSAPSPTPPDFPDYNTWTKAFDDGLAAEDEEKARHAVRAALGFTP